MGENYNFDYICPVCRATVNVIDYDENGERGEVSEL